jgi:hypothetical protein
MYMGLPVQHLSVIVDQSTKRGPHTVKFTKRPHEEQKTGYTVFGKLVGIDVTS